MNKELYYELSMSLALFIEFFNYW